MILRLAAVLVALAAPLAAGAASAAPAAADQPAAARTCDAVVADVDAARAGRDMARLDGLWHEAQAPAAACSTTVQYCVAQSIALTALDLAYADSSATPEHLLEILKSGATYSSPWQLEAALGDVQLSIGQQTHAAATYSEAAYAYQQALIALGEPPACGAAEAAARPAPADIQGLYHRMSAALLLAEPVRVATTRCAPCQWLFLAGVAGFTPAVRPLPITFPAGSDRPTPEGDTAITALLECLKAGKYSSITLTGHADPVGSASRNMALSQRRLETIRTRLSAGGFTGKIVIESRGETDPFPSAGEGFSPAEQRRLDRRLELTAADAPAGDVGCQ